MIIVALLELLVIILLGSVALLMLRMNCSSPSSIVSLYIETLNGILVIPAGNVILYGPE